MESRKMALKNLFAGQQWRFKHRERACGHSRGSRGWDRLRIAQKHINYHSKIASGNLLHDTGSSNPELCENLEGWDGVGGGGFKRKGTYVYL